MSLKVVGASGNEELARVFVGELDDGSRVEFVESVQPPLGREEKWVLIVSTLKGCPVGCPICDAGGDYRGKLTSEEILDQVRALVASRFPNGEVISKRVKVQLARMGEPAFNDEVIAALEELPGLGLPGLMPCISTVAPVGSERWCSELERVKRELYGGGSFQMQFSVHTTCPEARRRLVPIRTWPLERIAACGDRFFESGDRKISLNFAPARGLPLEPEVLAPLFSPERFLVKLTPINPTAATKRSGLVGAIDPADEDACRAAVESFESLGYETILSIGDLRENQIGSNCGMYVERMRRDRAAPARNRPIQRRA
jgi:23S rRNA (adenine2503-C2)-methyltransferase